MADGGADRVADVAEWLMAVGNPLDVGWPGHLEVTLASEHYFPGLSVEEWERALAIAGEVWIAAYTERLLRAFKPQGRPQ